MDKYEVMLYPRAYRDIDEIYAYIALEKLAPDGECQSINWRL
jgi:toxin ParE1/3/4